MGKIFWLNELPPLSEEKKQERERIELDAYIAFQRLKASLSKEQLTLFADYLYFENEKHSFDRREIFRSGVNYAGAEPPSHDNII